MNDFHLHINYFYYQNYSIRNYIRFLIDNKKTVYQHLIVSSFGRIKHMLTEQYDKIIDQGI